jgi:flagellar FliL protein
MMAKEKDKAEVKSDAKENAKGGGKSGILMIAAAALVSLCVGAGGAFFFLGSHAEAPAGPVVSEAEAMAAAEGDSHKQASDSYKERLFALEPLVVNVTGDGYNRFLKLRVELEAGDVGLKTEIEARLPQVRDALIVLLSSKQLSDITDFEGKALLKEDILERVNDLLESGDVKSVLFTEFVVQ